MLDHNVDLHLRFVPSKENLADAPSRKLDLSDTMLSESSWLLVEKKFGPHSVDLMALDSNAMRACDGTSLRHFTPWKTPDTSGVNVFSQNLREEGNMYVYPPFVLIFPVLCLLEEQGVSCTLVAQKPSPLPVWWPKLKSCSRKYVCLGQKTQKGVVKIPTRNGFLLDTVDLRQPLYAFRLSFS